MSVSFSPVKLARVKVISKGVIRLFYYENLADGSGYTHLTEDVKKVIDRCITEIKEIIQKHGYKKIYYSAKTPNGLLGTSIFKVGDDVIDYITSQIKLLSK